MWGPFYLYHMLLSHVECTWWHMCCTMNFGCVSFFREKLLGMKPSYQISVLLMIHVYWVVQHDAAIIHSTRRARCPCPAISECISCFFFVLLLYILSIIVRRLIHNMTLPDIQVVK